MPQMYPLNWLILFFMFLMMFFLINSINYFYFLLKPMENNSIMKKYKFDWMW
uniref:ATP synthase complex subunit 8 n=1 Tax=Cephalcia infumata TaxID=2048903 RepID=A0A8H2SJ23_9HYME|nr:ATP synthase F0 subunit 8 [Cephalcia infumata]